MSPKVIMLCIVSVIAPIGFVVMQNPDILPSGAETDPSQGHLLYFTLPG